VDLKPEERAGSAVGTGTIDGLDIGYSSIRGYLEKSLFLLDDDDARIDCGVCNGRLCLEDELVVVCSEESCLCASHILCLASRFLKDEGTNTKIIPTSGTCPSCRSRLEWSTLMREISLRTRGQKEVEKLIKKRWSYMPALTRQVELVAKGSCGDEGDNSDDECGHETIDLTGSDDQWGQNSTAKGDVHSSYTNFVDELRACIPTGPESDSSQKNRRNPRLKHAERQIDWDGVDVLD